MNERPLDGLRVLDFSWVWSGPLVAATLAELGAQVIKIEHGERLDNSRLRGRPTRGGRAMEGPSIEIGPYFHQTNHDKLSISIDLKSPKALGLLDRLVSLSDIVVENLSPGALSRAGLGYPRLRGINPRLIYLSMSGAGQEGPLSSMKAYAPIMSSYCGFERLVGYPGGEVTGMMNFGLGDPNAAVHALVPLLAAVLDRESTGQGAHIDLSQIEALLSVMPEPLIDCLMNGRDATHGGNRHPGMSPHGIFPVSGDDCWVSIAVEDDPQWERLVDAMGTPAWAARAEYSSLAGRRAHEGPIEERLGDWTRLQDGRELSGSLRALGIACSPVLDVRAQWEDAHFIARGIRQDAVHPISGAELLYRTPWTVERGGPQVRDSAPILGSSNAHVFGEILGMSAGEIAELTAEQVLV